MGAFVGSWPSSLSEISLDKATRDVAGFEGNEAQFKQFVRRIATDAPEGRIQPGSSFYFCRPHPADQETYVFRYVAGSFGGHRTVQCSCFCLVY